MTNRLRLAIALLSVAFLLLPLIAEAQNTTIVTATITDPNGLPYSNAKVQAQLIPAGITPRIPPPCNGQSASPCFVSGFTSATADVTGSFSMNLASNAVLTPGGTQWQFTVNETGIAPPAGTGPQSCTATITISGASQSISSNFFSCPVLSLAGGGGVNGSAVTLNSVVQSGLIGEYRILPTETAGGLIDYSGNGNNATGTDATPPTVIPITGGLNCGALGAVKLPSNLNSTLTIQVYISYANFAGGNVFDSPVVGATAGALAGGTGIIFQHTLNNPGNAFPYWPFTFGAGFHILSRVAFTGAGSLTMAMTNPNDTLYVNGVTEIDSGGVMGNGTSAGVMSSPQVYQLCGASNGGNPLYFHGNVYYVLFYNRLLSTTEIAQNTQFMANVMASRGVPPSFSPTDTTSQLVVDGDSVSSSNQGFGTPGWPLALTIPGNPITVVDTAVPGLRAVLVQNHIALNVDPNFRINGERNLAILFAGTNDLANISTPATVWGQLQSSCFALKKLHPWKVALVSMVSRGGNSLVNGLATNDSLKNTYDTFIRGNWSNCADSFMDFAADPNIGADGAAAGGFPTYFLVDAIHPSQNSIYNIETPIANRAIARLYGAQDFSSASVYNSAAAAATATTAGTESTNTMTLTFGANPFQVGNSLVCTGITPAGYNSPAGLGWTVITRTATQVTLFNPTTGLGPITVQGQCSTPQQADGDKYYIVNFGAGNTTLETCRGYTGQNIYIRNINAAASTLVPFQSETITGTAAPTTLAANSTAILQSQLVSSSAAACNWVRLQ